MSVIVRNRKAQFDYFVMEEMQAGIVLNGNEIKSVREHNCSLDGSYATLDNHEAWLIGMHIQPYKKSELNPTRRRKLLLTKQEIRTLKGALEQDGLTAVPLSVFLLNGYAKVQLGIVKGKKQHDKREAIRTRDAEREMR